MGAAGAGVRIGARGATRVCDGGVRLYGSMLRLECGLVCVATCERWTAAGRVDLFWRSTEGAEAAESLHACAHHSIARRMVAKTTMQHRERAECATEWLAVALDSME